LVDDFHAYFSKTIDVRFAGTKIAAFDRVVEQPEHAIPVVLVILGGIDSTLGSDTMRAPWTVLETEAFYIVAKFGKGRRCRSSGQPGADYQNIKLSFVSRTDQL
jgi:hypothetical protein